MAEKQPAPPEISRRNLILLSAFAAALLASLGAIPAWLGANPHRGIDLAMQAVPPTSGAALLAGLCIGFHGLSPYPRPSFVTAVTFPLMHVAITVALARLLSAPTSALSEPMPQQLPIQAWLAPKTWGAALGAELFCFFVAATIARRRPPVAEC